MSGGVFRENMAEEAMVASMQGTAWGVRKKEATPT
jgi:hypothetical protein